MGVPDEPSRIRLADAEVETHVVLIGARDQESQIRVPEVLVEVVVVRAVLQELAVVAKVAGTTDSGLHDAIDRRV